MNVQFKKGVLDLCVLAMLNDSDRYGYELASTLSEIIGLGADNINGHILFGMMGHDCETTICNGKVLMQNFELKTCDEEKIYAECRAEADKLHFSING